MDETEKLSKHHGELRFSEGDHIIVELESHRVTNLVIESKFADNNEITIQIAKQKATEILQSGESNNFHDVLGELKKASSSAGEDELFLNEKEEIQQELESCKHEIEELSKEKKELEISVVSLTEENRDITGLLKIALVEKEALEKSLNRINGNNEQRRSGIMQFAEKGLQKVGFGFIIGGGLESSEHSFESSGANVDDKSTSSECDEEVTSLASSMERVMKKLRLEIGQLRRSLGESRSENERQQTFIDKQAQEIAQFVSYANEFKDREVMFSQNNEELQLQIKQTEEEVVRWREACELEAETGKNILEERENAVKILQQELEKSRTALNRSTEKLKIKEELVDAAIAAQKAAEKSLQLADSRVAGFRAQIEEWTRHIEEAEKKDRANRRKIVRYICWPWHALKFNLTNTTNTGIKVMLPEMQTLLP